ncbi:unnamed protein product [Didymodactylos carnosus]|uniref:Protein kinase A anchor protein nuclear localisation signal domain-containing protein n=1 Tax=Didymodactylos carnosus TaxID=1234261 RepID=A0A8S2J162_9BILA|nr:unnamed protein product [Didymodactylos carnosus]CAF3786151.1 unnamed protein product [Didymodactylos carnosus]
MIILSSLILIFAFIVVNRSKYVTLTYAECNDDPLGTSPYVVPENQSILYYNPNVQLKPPYSTCSWVPEGFTSTPKIDCPQEAQNVLMPRIPLNSCKDLVTSTMRAQSLINNSNSVIYLQNVSTIHCSLAYFSCYTDLENDIIQQMLNKFKWTSFTLAFDDVSCDVSTVSSYLVAVADSLSQKTLFNLVRNLEHLITEKGGVNIKLPRLETFHMTLAGVTYQYSSDCKIEELRTKLLPTLPMKRLGSVRVMILRSASMTQDGETAKYRLCDSVLHLPENLIKYVGTLTLAAEVAAPIRNECPE